MSRPRRPARHGRVARAVGLLLGVSVAAGVVVALQVPLLDQPDQATLTLSHLPLTTGVTPALAWPSAGSAAVVIPAYGVRVANNEDVVPIASLTKMMTAYVALHALPLADGATGPCLTINDADLATYQHMVGTGQSSVAVDVGEVVCERDLLNGMLVHSANNYALLLAVMVGGSVDRFVGLMNQTAERLGLTHTHYEEPSGYASGSVSTALEQGALAVDLMASPLARSIVDQTSVTLPVAGTVATFTPDLGVDGVVGVKSGRTAAAGGCVVLAMQFARGPSTRTLYAVVLGQRGGNLLGPAGDAALALATSARANQLRLVFARGTRVATLGWGGRVTPVALTSTHALWWWAGGRPLHVAVHLARLTSRVRAGEVVGWLGVGSRARFAISVVRSVAPPTVWQRLR